MVQVKTASIADLSMLYSLTSVEAHVKDNQYFETCLEEQSKGFREVYILEEGGQMKAYCFYQRRPKYQPFRSLEIPEIQDLYVGPDFRLNGYASSLIRHCFETALHEGKDMIGVGVGVDRNYGKAQRLYVKMGFEPDGAGVVYERNPAMLGQAYKIDDELCLMLVKKLK